jgi:hypothetical protein
VDASGDLYAYVDNDPVNSFDELGLMPDKPNRNRGGGDNPLYNESCENLWKLYNAASGANTAKINTILKLRECKGSGHARGQKRIPPVPCPDSPPEESPKTAPKPGMPEPVEPEPAPESIFTEPIFEFP